MHDDLDLRVIERHHVAEPQFREALRNRVTAIVDGTHTSPTEPDGPEAVIVEHMLEREARGARQSRRWVASAAVVVGAAAAIVGIIVVSPADDTSSPTSDSVLTTDPSVESTVAIVEPIPVVTPELFTEIAPGTMVDLPDAPIIGRNGTAMVWTGTEMVVWGGSAYDPVTDTVPGLSDGAALNLANGTWRVIGESPLSGRHSPAAAWTGTEMIVWGGFLGDDLRINDGAAYNPNTDSWRMLPEVPFGMGQGGIVTMVWTGDEAVISDGAATAAYNPVTDSWRRLDRVVGGADPVWTGNAVIWVSDTLTRWDVATDTWTVVPGSYAEVVGIPSADGIMRTFVALPATMGEPVHILDESLVPIADLPPFPDDSALFDGKIDASANWVGVEIIFTIWAGVFPHEPTQVWALNPTTHTWRQLSDAVPDGPVVVGDVVLAWGEENGPNVKTIGVAYRAGPDLSN